MDYGAVTRWKVTEVNPKGNPRFDLQVSDTLEVAGSTIRMHREGSSPIDWGSGCTYDPKTLTFKGNHNASAGGAEFSITIQPGGTHKGEIGGPGTGSNGTWTAEEGG